MLRDKLLGFLPQPVADLLRLVRVVWFPKEYEPELAAVIRQLVQPGWVCVDVGANIGIISCLLAKLAQSTGRVIAFEAFPGNARLLARMAKWSGLASRITVENMAVSDGIQSELVLYSGRGGASEEWNILGHDLDGNRTEAVLRIPATSLDDYFPPCSPVHFVKIDIEGAGAQAFRGMRRILRESRPYVLVEFHDDDEWNGREELLVSGYELYDVKGRKLNPAVDVQRVYHCLACPAEKEFKR